MKEEREGALKKIERIYNDDLKCKIDSYIILFGTKSLEKLLNEIFKERHIKPIKIKSKLPAVKTLGISPMEIKIKDVKIKP